jgi:hypothetical protein
MIALTVVAIVLLPILGMVLGSYIVLQRRRGSVDVMDIPLLVAAILVVGGQAVLEWAHTQAGMQFIPGNMAWVAWMRTCGCIVGYALTRKYFSQGMWLALTAICAIGIFMNWLPIILRDNEEVRSAFVLMNTFAVANFIALPALLMARNTSRVASGRMATIGYASFVIAAILLVLYPTVIPVTTSVGSMPGLVLADGAMLAVLVGVILTRPVAQRITA